MSCEGKGKRDEKKRRGFSLSIDAFTPPPSPFFHKKRQEDDSQSIGRVGSSHVSYGVDSVDRYRPRDNSVGPESDDGLEGRDFGEVLWEGRREGISSSFKRRWREERREGRTSSDKETVAPVKMPETEKILSTT